MCRIFWINNNYGVTLQGSYPKPIDMQYSMVNFVDDQAILKMLRFLIRSCICT